MRIDDDLLEEIVYAIFNGEISLDEPNITITEIKKFITDKT